MIDEQKDINVECMVSGSHKKSLKIWKANVANFAIIA
jgi:hypothetical protein